MLKWIVVTASLLLPSIACAGDAAPPRPEDAAMRAQQVVESHCAGMGTDRVAVRADALGAIGPAYADVSASYEHYKKDWLLYWRGVLGQCLGELESAQVDLYAFATKLRDEPSLASLVRDAQRRLRIIERYRRRSVSGVAALSPRQGVGVALGVGLLAGAAAGGVGAGAEAAALQRVRDDLYKGHQPRAALDSLVAEGEATAQRQSVALGLGIGLGVGSALGFLVAALPQPRGVVARWTNGPAPLGLGLEGRF